MKKAKESLLFAVSFYLLMGFTWMTLFGHFILDFLIRYDKIDYDEHFFVRMIVVSLVAWLGAYFFIHKTYWQLRKNEE